MKYPRPGRLNDRLRNEESKSWNWFKSERKRERLAKHRARLAVVEERLRAIGAALADMDECDWAAACHDFPELAALAARLEADPEHPDGEIEEELARWFPSLLSDRSLGANWLQIEADQLSNDLALAGVFGEDSAFDDLSMEDGA